MATRATKDLIVVESPTKVRTISKLLGKGYTVMATMGHVMDLPKSTLAVDTETFEAEFTSVRGKAKVLTELKKAAGEADRVLLASDPDREGEAIAFHAASALAKKDRGKIHRVLIEEITASGLAKALADPREINGKLVEAQMARRVLDRLVGYSLSPLLWKRVRRGLSAGRVQSVALKFLCDREAAIEAFVPREYWTLTATLAAGAPPPFTAALTKWEGKKAALGVKGDADAAVAALSKASWTVASVGVTERRVSAPPPLTTSLLQQEGWKRYRFPAKKTMSIAQQLYEGIDLPDGGRAGLITYMRTDSFRVAPEAEAEARAWVEQHHGGSYLPAAPPRFKAKKSAQEAHEAIRPTAVARTPESLASVLTPEQRKLYELIWRRFVASQMAPQLQEVTKVEIAAGPGTFETRGVVVRFDGFRRVLSPVRPEDREEDDKENDEEGDGTLPPLATGEVLELRKLDPQQNFTQPPPRFSEATLVKELEEQGIGRPSTYAAIISILLDREYALREKGKFRPTPLGRKVNDFLTAKFSDLIRADFTATMEEDLDGIEEGRIPSRKEVLAPFWERLKENIDRVGDEPPPADIPTDLACPTCGKPLVIRWGKRGEFLACTGYVKPKGRKKAGEEVAAGCTFTSEFERRPDGSVGIKEPEETGKVCPACGKPMLLKNGRFGDYLACSNYPACKTTRPLGTGIRCPEEGCGGELVKRMSRKGPFTGCGNYPACKYVAWGEPVDEICPVCGHTHLIRKRMRGKETISCPKTGCGYRREEGGK
jgi:DNA topoisomerase-1